MDVVELQDGRVDLLRGFVSRGGVEAPLSTKEIELLAYLAGRPGRVVGWDELHREVWHHGPRVVSRAAYFTWRRLVQKLEADPDRPAHLLGHHGDGVSFVGPGGSRPLPAPAPAPRTNLGADGTSFVGREVERARAAAAFAAGARLVTLVGPAGAGKSRLARELAVEHLGAGEVWVCPLHDCPKGGVRERIAATLGLTDRGALAPALQARAALLVLDGCEAVIREVAEVVGEVLGQTRAARLLVASRERTQRTEEVAVEVGPLGDDEAAALFVARVHQSDPDRALDPAAVAALVRRLDRLPLAIELAAARARVLSPAELADRLDARFDLLQRRGADGPHGSLWAAIHRSWELLAPELQAAWARLSVTRGGFDLAAAEALLAPAPALDLVEALCDASIVHLVPGPGPLRFGLYESLAAFADRQLDGPGRAEARDRHAEVYAARARRWLDAALRAEPEAPAAIGRDRANLEASLDLPADDPRLASCVLALAWEGPGRRSPRVPEALDRALAVDGPSRVELLLQRARLRLQAGDHEGAGVDARDARAVLDERSPPERRGDLALVEAGIAAGRGDPSAALAALERTDPATLPPHRALQWLSTRGNVLLDLGRAREARDTALEHLRRAQASGLPAVARQSRVNLAFADLALGRPDAAAATLAEVRPEFAGRDAYAEAVVCNLLGCAELARGRPAAAEEALTVSRDLHLSHGAVGRAAQAEANLAAALRASGRSREALAVTERVLATHRATGHQRSVLTALSNQALDALACGEVATLDRALDEARALARDPLVRLRLGCLAAMRHARFGTRPDAERALAEVRDPAAEGESAALLALAEAFVAGGGEPPDPMPPFAAVRFGWSLLTKPRG